MTNVVAEDQRELDSSPTSAAGLGTTKTVNKTSWMALLVAGTGMGFDAYVINLPVILLPLIADTYHTPIATIASIQSLFMVGYLFGTIGFNVIADIIGRSLALELSIAGYTIVTVLNGFAPTVGWFSAGRALTGLLAGGEQGVGAIYAAEAWPDKWRGFGTAMMFAFYPPGVMITIGAALVVVPYFGWRGAFALTFVMGLAIYLMRKMVFESSRFAKVKKADEAKGASKRISLAQFWSNRSLRRSTISLLLINLGDNFTYHGMSVIGLIWLRSTFQLSTSSFFMVLLILYAVQFVQCVIGAYLLDIVGRRPIGIFCAICAGIGVPMLGFVSTLPAAIVLMALTWSLWLGPGWGTKMALNPEVFPTEARGTGMALTHGVGRFGAILSPLLESYLLVTYGPSQALYAFAVSCAVIVVGYLIAPELARRPIPDFISETATSTR